MWVYAHTLPKALLFLFLPLVGSRWNVDQVQESGEGYTLSGKPLDLNSAAARQYGLNTNTNLKTAERSNAHSTDPISSPNPRVSISCAPSNEIESSYEDDSDNPTTSFKNSSSSRYNTRKSERESKTPISVQDGTSKRVSWKCERESEEGKKTHTHVSCLSKTRTLYRYHRKRV